ncbi:MULTISPECIES: 3-oxoacyl-ACP synthase III family protein [unclassified Streptomyces]|uniref:3-oxoacyl-ACP synthase III family protein n=1 Tax=unclassified Streptomyces TaxID=2593676 RepID=UPI0032525FEB
MDYPEVRLAGVGTSLPGPPIDNAALVKRFDLPAVWEQWIETFVGTSSRYFSVDITTGKLEHSLADLGVQAATRALASAGAAPGDIDLIIMGTATPDLLMPATVNVIADRLGINDVPSFQLQSGCTGAIQALSLAMNLLTTGQARTALVLGGETCAKFLDLDMDLRNASFNMQVNALLFGDGAGASVLTTAPVPGAPVLRRAYTRLVGHNRPPGQVVKWFGSVDQGAGEEPVVEDFKAIELSAPKMATEVLDELLDDLDWDRSELDYVLPPQLSGRMTDRVIEALAIPSAKPVSRVAEIGNTANAIPFFQLEQVLGGLQLGDRVVGVSVEASKWIKAGYALELPYDGRQEN